MQKNDANKEIADNKIDADISSLKSHSPIKTLFILGNPLPKLGDKTALNKFLEGSRGDTANQQTPVQSHIKAPVQLEIANKSGLVMPPLLSVKTNEMKSVETEVPKENSNISEKSKEKTDAESKKVKEDFPPPITSVFSFNLPALAAKKSQDMNKMDSQVLAPQKKNYSMSSLENQALNYLNQLQEGQSKYDSLEVIPVDCPVQIPEVLIIECLSNLSNTITNNPNTSQSQKNSFFSSQPNIYRRDNKIIEKIANDNQITPNQLQISNQNEQSTKLFLGHLQQNQALQIKMLASNALTEQDSTKLPAVNDSSNSQSNLKKNFDPLDKQFEQFANFGAFLKQRGTLPINVYNPGASKNIQNPVQSLTRPNSTQSTGDLILSKYHTYNSIGTLAPLVNQDENLSIALNSKNVKIFINEDPHADAKNLIVFVENIQSLQQSGQTSQLFPDSLQLQQNQMVDTSNNISFLVNQNEQVTNILSSYHQKNMLLGTILDFTVRKFRFLYILYAKSIVILDFKDLIQQSDSSQMNNQNNEIQIVDSIQLIQPNIFPSNSLHLNNLHLFNSIEVLNSNEQSLLLFNDIASRRAGLAFNFQNIKSSAKTAQSSQVSQVSLNAANEADLLGSLSGGKVLQNEQGIDQLKSNEQCKSQILHIDCSNFKPNESSYHGSFNTQYSLQQGHHVQTLLQFGEDMPKNGSIMDIEMWQTYLAVLFEKNVILVYDFALSQSVNSTEIISPRNNSQKQKQKAKKVEKESGRYNQNSTLKKIIQFEKPIFKVKFADATESITQIFFIQDFTQVKSENSSNYQNSLDSSSEHEKSYQLFDSLETKKLKGQFLLVESQATSLNKQGNNQMKDAGKKTFRKLHIVEIQDLIGPLYLSENQKGNKGPSQFLKQIDQLSITEQTSKFVSYNPEQGIVFLLNVDKQDRLIRLFSVKLKKDTSELDSDSDEGHKMKDSYYFQKHRFEYITEVRLQISNQSFSAIQKVSLAKYKNIVQQAVPVYLKVLRIKSEKVGVTDEDNFYIYINILDQVIVFQRSLIDLRPTSQDMVKLLSGTKNSHVNDYKQASIKQFQSISQSGTPNLQDNKHSIIDLLTLGKIPSTYKEDILRKSRDMMQGNYSVSKNIINVDSEQEEEEELPMNQQNLFEDENQITGDMQQQHQNSEKIVNEILSEESDTSQPEPARDARLIQQRANVLMEMIEKECREEAEIDALLLQQIITEETKDVFSINEEENLAASIEAVFSFDEEEVIQKGKQDSQFEQQRQLFSENVQSSKEKLQSLGEKGLKKDFVYIKKEKDSQIDMIENSSAGKKDKKQKKQANKKCSQSNQQKKPKDCKEQDYESDCNNGKIRLNRGEAQIQNHQSESISIIQTQNQPTPTSNLFNRTNSPQQLSTFQKKKPNVNSQKQQDQIVENFQELTRKYQDLAQKMNKLQQQVQRQQQQKIEVENIIRKAVRDSIGGLINQQIKEIVVPEMTKKIKSLDSQLTEVLLPRIEEQMCRILKETVERGDLQDKQNSESDQLNQQMIQSLIQKEFREAMITKIVPSIETCIKKLLQQLENKLQQVDVALCEKLSEEEERHESMIQHYQNSLVWLKKFHIKMGNLSKEQLKGQMIQQVEYSKEIAKEYQNEWTQKVNDNILGQINMQIQSQIKNQVQNQMQQLVQQQVQAQMQLYQAGNSVQVFDEDPQLRLQSQIQNMIQSQLHQSLHGQQYYLPQVASQHLSQSNVIPHPSFQPPIPSYVQQQNYSLQRKTSNLYQNQQDNFIKLQQQSANHVNSQIITTNQFDIHGSIQSPQQDTETIQIMAQMNDLQRKLKIKQQQSNQQNSASSKINNIQSQFSSSKKLQPQEENKTENAKFKIDYNNETGLEENNFDGLEDPDMYLNQHKSSNTKKQSQVSELTQDAKKKVKMGNVSQKFRDRNTPLKQNTTLAQGFDLFEELDAKRGSEKEDADDREYGQEDFANHLNDFLFNNNIGTTYADEPRVVKQEYKQDRSLRPYDDNFVPDQRILHDDKKQQKAGKGQIKTRETFENQTDRHISALLRGTTGSQQIQIAQNLNQDDFQDFSGFDGQKQFSSNIQKNQIEKDKFEANPINDRTRHNPQKYSFTESTGVGPANFSSGVENNQNRGAQKLKPTRELTSWKDSQKN